jgi:hypothetical protein
MRFQATDDEGLDEEIKRSYHLFVTPVFHRGGEDAVAIIVVQDYYVFVPTQRCCWESACEIRLDLIGFECGGIHVMTLVFLDHVFFWRRYFHNWLCGTDVLADFIHIDLCCCIRFEQIFTYIGHSDRWLCCKMSILDGFNPRVCYGAETARM